MVNRTRTFSFIKIFVLLFIIVLFPRGLFAASIFFNPNSTQVSQGDIFSISIMTDTQGAAINNADAVINFPKDLLDVQSVSKNGSIFTIWVEDPTFSNSSGTITLNGGLPNPGFTGSKGKILSIVFQAKKAGNATVLFASANVRANDGVGTNILSARQSGTITIGSSLPPVIQAPIPQSNVPKLPIITSSTNPVTNEWYKDSTAVFNWNITSGVTSIQTLLSKSALSIPSVQYDASVSQKTISQIADGVHYFHLRFTNSSGNGPTAHYKIQIDGTAPDSFNPTIIQNGVRTQVTLKARDITSGVDHYAITFSDGTLIMVKPSELSNNMFVLPVTEKGEQKISLVAVDKAGNSTDSVALSYEAPEITIPSLTINPDELQKGERVMITGNTEYVRTSLVVYVGKNESDVDQYQIITSDDGSFSLKSDELQNVGKQYVWAQLVFSGNVKSTLSEKKTLLVKETELVRISRAVIYRLILIIIIILLLIAVFFALFLGWHKYFGLKKKLTNELDEVAKSVHGSFTLFKEELSSQLQILENAKIDRNLNRKEQKIFKELQENIDSIDEFVEKKLKKLK